MRIKKNPLEELAKEINAKARELQNVTESRDGALQAIRELGERKQKLVSQLNDLENSIRTRQEHFDELAKKEQAFVAAIEKEKTEKSASLQGVLDEIEKVKKELETSESVLRERYGLLEKMSDARAQYLSWENRLGTVQKQCLETEKKFQDEKLYIETGKKELGEQKADLSDLYGKVASYVRVAKETLEYVNKELERKGTPVRFGIPEGEILSLTIDNFNEQQT